MAKKKNKTFSMGFKNSYKDFCRSIDEDHYTPIIIRNTSAKDSEEKYVFMSIELYNSLKEKEVDTAMVLSEKDNSEMAFPSLDGDLYWNIERDFDNEQGGIRL